jgi:hypothetical protein
MKLVHSAVVLGKYLPEVASRVMNLSVVVSVSFAVEKLVPVTVTVELAVTSALLATVAVIVNVGAALAAIVDRVTVIV